ncbi:tol-pal system protein YbgF [Emcibacter sp.]|uniref:tol-pal system protein YbgF n=1 Tax=Emcibacter sp. TaxID=1979954 RepID=UPI002AA7CB28|nr:tol-pal system protein YbgF [Emcibacter sp.]
MIRETKRTVGIGVLSAFLIAAISICSPVQAESLEKKVEILEKQLRAVQRKVFTPGSYFEQDGAASGQQATAPSPQSGVLLADMEARVTQIETQMRQLTGQIEESNYRITQLTNRLETLVKDYEFRLSELEGGGKGASPAAVAAAPVDSKPAATSAGGSLLPKGTEKEQYDFAYGLVTKGDYTGAERALSEFLKQHPDHALAGNAKYWLGQTYYVRGMYTDATRTFLEGYNDYPQHAKAPGFLLKIGMSLNAMGEKNDACEAYRELSARFPDSTENKNRRQAEEKKAGCQ